jgi:flagellar basal body-associated protein FliL
MTTSTTTTTTTTRNIILVLLVIVSLIGTCSLLVLYVMNTTESQQDEWLSYFERYASIDALINLESKQFYHVYMGPISSEEVKERKVKLPRLLFKKVTSGFVNLNNTEVDELGSRMNNMNLKFKDLQNETDVDKDYSFIVERDIILDYNMGKFFYIIKDDPDTIVNNTRYQFYQDDALDKDVLFRKRRSNAIMIAVIVVIIIILIAVILFILYLLYRIQQGCSAPGHSEIQSNNKSTNYEPLGKEEETLTSPPPMTRNESVSQL